jgi:hypothetical protein
MFQQDINIKDKYVITFIYYINIFCIYSSPYFGNLVSRVNFGTDVISQRPEIILYTFSRSTTNATMMKLQNQLTVIVL